MLIKHWQQKNLASNPLAVKKAYFHRNFCGGEHMIAHFWDKHKSTNINDRQRLVINYLYDNCDKETGFLRTSTYAKLTQCSTDTALRDLQDLVSKEMLKAEDSGKKINYIIVSPKGIRIPKIST